jgi:hypothetical protein
MRAARREASMDIKPTTRGIIIVGAIIVGVGAVILINMALK